MKSLAAHIFFFQNKVAVCHDEDVGGLTYSFTNAAYKSGEMNWEEFPYENIKLLGELGSGAFGVVFKGELLQDNGKITPCAVKALKRKSCMQGSRVAC